MLQHWSEDGAAPWVKCRYVGRAKSKGFWVVGPSPWCAFTQLTQKCTSHALHDDVMRMTGSSSMQLSHALAALPPASEGRRSVAPQPLGHGSPIGRARPSRQPAGRGSGRRAADGAEQRNHRQTSWWQEMATYTLMFVEGGGPSRGVGEANAFLSPRPLPRWGRCARTPSHGPALCGSAQWWELVAPWLRGATQGARGRGSPPSPNKRTHHAPSPVTDRSPITDHRSPGSVLEKPNLASSKSPV